MTLCLPLVVLLRASPPRGVTHMSAANPPRMTSPRGSASGTLLRNHLSLTDIFPGNMLACGNKSARRFSENKRRPMI